MSQHASDTILWHFLRGTIKSIPLAGSFLDQFIYGPLDSKKRTEESKRLYTALHQLQGQLKTLEEIAVFVKPYLTLSAEGDNKLKLLRSSIASIAEGKTEGIPSEIAKAYSDSLADAPLNAYLADLSEELRLWRGLGMPIPVGIEDIYVPVTLSDVSKNERQLFEVGNSVDGFLSKRTDTGNLLIKGPPGSGKSTLLRHLALMQTDLVNESLSDTIPIFLHLPAIERLCEDESNWHLTLPDIIARKLSHHGDERFLEALHRAVSDVIESGNAVILLDAVDEISEKDYAVLKSWISHICAVARHCHIVLTSRPLYLVEGLHSFHAIYTEPFSREKQDLFINRWFRSVKEIRRGAEMIEYLQQPEMFPVRDTSVLSGNPLFLTMMCIEYVLTRKVSRTPAELIDHFTQILLEDWDFERGVKRIRDKKGLELKRLVIESIASGYFEDNKAVFYLE